MRRAALIRSACLVAAVTCATAHSQFTTWTNGTGNRLWGDPGNWNNGVPQPGGRAQLQGPGVPIDLGGVWREVDRIECRADGFSLNNGTIAVNSVGGLTSGAPAALTFNARLTAQAALASLQPITPDGQTVVAGGIGPGTFNVSATGVLLTSRAEHAGQTYVTDLRIEAGGALASTSRIEVESLGILQINSTGAPGEDRLNDPAAVATGHLSRLGMAATGASPAVERTGRIELGGGLLEIELSAPGAAGVELRSEELVRTDPRASVRLALAPTARFAVTTPPTLPSGGSDPTERAIVPWMIATPATGTPPVASWVTHDAGFLRPLDAATEYAPSLAGATVTPLTNVRVASGQTLSSSRTVNSLIVSGLAELELPVGATLDLTSGGLALTGATGGAAGVRSIRGDGTLRAPGELRLWSVGSDSATRAAGYRVDAPINAASMTFNGDAVVRLGKSNAIPGGVLVQSGELVAAAPGALGAGPIETELFATIGFEGGAHTLAQPWVTRGGGIRVAAGSQVTLQGPVSGTSLTKSGGGVLRIDSDWLVEGASLSNTGGGIVEINGKLGNNPASLTGGVSGAGIRGTGRIDGRVRGEISPGPDGGIGRLTVAQLTNTSFLNPKLLFEINGPSAGTSYDQLVVTQSAALANASFPTASSTYSLLVDFGFAPVVGQAFTIIDMEPSGAVVGRFNGLPENTTFTADGVPLRITYFGGNGNDVVLTVIPEPSGLASLCAAGFAGARRRQPKAGRQAAVK